MTRPIGKTIAALAGLAVLALGAILGGNWKEVYFALYPEARFFGRWERVGPDGRRGLLFHLPLLVEFRAGGAIAFPVDVPPGSGTDGLVTAGEDVRAALLGLPVGLKYGVEGERIIFATHPRGPDRSVSARYRFENVAMGRGLAAAGETIRTTCHGPG